MTIKLTGQNIDEEINKCNWIWTNKNDYNVDFVISITNSLVFVLSSNS